MGRFSLRVAEHRGVAYGDVERSRRAVSDARHESVAQHVQWHDEQSAPLRWSKMDTARRRARTREPNSWCQSSLQHAGGDFFSPCEGAREQRLSERNGMIGFRRIRERFGKTAGVSKLSDVFQFQWASSDSLEDKWLRWQKLMRQVNMTSLGDDARETLTSASLEKAKE